MPRLIVSQRVIDKMVHAAQRYVDDETGEALVGLLMKDADTGINTLYVLDTVAPDETAERERHMVAHGDTWQEDIVDWLRQNWRFARDKRGLSFGRANAAKWDAELRHLGDWHKQPGYMIHPSGGDLMTALDILNDPERDMRFLLAPILTVGHPYTTANEEAAGNFVLVPQDEYSCIRIDFWYIARDFARGIRGFQAIVPQVVAADKLPRLTAHPWHLTDEAFAREEYERLEEDGLFTTMVLWNADDKPPLEICFMVARMGSDKVLIVITPANYPEKRPAMRVAPFIGIGPNDELFAVFERMWAQSQEVKDPPGWTWTPETTLLDYVHVVEKHLDIEQVRPPGMADAAVSAAPAEVATATPAEDASQMDAPAGTPPEVVDETTEDAQS